MFDWIGWAVIAGLGIVIVVGLVRSFMESDDEQADEGDDDDEQKEERDLQAEAWSEPRERSTSN